MAAAYPPATLLSSSRWRIDVHGEAGKVVHGLSFVDALEVVPPRLKKPGGARNEIHSPASPPHARSKAATCMATLKCPNDFTDHAPSKTNRQLAEKYGVGEKTITRWRKETGCTATIRPFASAALPKQHVPSISPGLASEAAQFLRKTHRPVYHRIIEGVQFKGTYVVGTQLLTEREVVELAQEKGFQLYNGLFDLAS